MTEPELFSLRWNDFQSNLIQGIHTFLECEDLVDVTLSAEGQFMRAHKLVLSICSPYFKNIFKASLQSNTCGQPIVIIKDVQAEHLKQILNFVYTGEVTIHRHELSSFLQTAELLQIKGLTSTSKPDINEKPELPERPPSTELDLSVVDRSSFISEVNNSHDVIKKEIEEKDVNSISQSNLSDISSPISNYNSQKRRSVFEQQSTKRMRNEWSQGYDTESSSGSEQYPDGETIFNPEVNNENEWPGNPSDSFEQRIDTEGWTTKYDSDRDPRKKDGWKSKGGGVKCASCNRIFANRYNLKVHVRDKHDTLEGTLQCHICNKSMRNPSCLRVHLYHHRKQAALGQNNIMDQPNPNTNDDSDDTGPTESKHGIPIVQT